MFPEHCSMPQTLLKREGLKQIRLPISWGRNKAWRDWVSLDPHQGLSSPVLRVSDLNFQITWRVRNEWKALSRSSLCLTPVLFPRNMIPSLLLSLIDSPPLLIPRYLSSSTFASFCSGCVLCFAPTSPPFWFPQSFGNPTGLGPSRLFILEPGLKKRS